MSSFLLNAAMVSTVFVSVTFVTVRALEYIFGAD